MLPYSQARNFFTISGGEISVLVLYIYMMTESISLVTYSEVEKKRSTCEYIQQSCETQE